MCIRYIAMFIGSAVPPDAAALKERPGVELYSIDVGPSAEEEIEIALLTDPVSDIKLSFVGSEEARRYAEIYYGTWVQATPSVCADLLAYWDSE